MRRFASLAALGLLLALPLIATAHQSRSGPELHETQVGVAAPPIVTQALADSAATLAGTPFEVVPLVDAEDEAASYRVAKDAVGDGRLDAAVVLDLRHTTDTLLVTTTRTDAYVDALRDRLSVISKGYGRTLEIEYVDPAGAAGTARTPGLLVVAWCAIGVLVVAVISAERGPVPTLPNSAARLLIVASAGAICGAVSAAVVAPGSARPAAALVLAATVTVTLTGGLVIAAESVLGVAGLGVAAALMTGPALPLLSGVTPDLLAEPWHTLDRVSPQTAAWQVARVALGHADGAAGSWALIAAWAALALLTLLTAQAVRPDADDPSRPAVVP